MNPVVYDHSEGAFRRKMNVKPVVGVLFPVVRLVAQEKSIVQYDVQRKLLQHELNRIIRWPITGFYSDFHKTSPSFITP
jgi:hypothetical protein